MNFFAPANIQQAVAGKWLSNPPADASPTAAVSTDTRTIAPGDLFIPLHGEHHDAHDFARLAAQAGARIILADNPNHPAVVQADAHQGCSVLCVPDTNVALLALAAAYRKSLTNTRVIAVTGSNGKTTTVRLIQAALASQFNVCASKKSFNNHVGLPLTVLAAKPTDDFLICEMGTSNPGEIALLAATCQPDIAVLTSLGRAHAGRFDSFDALLAEKASIFHHLAPGALAIVPASFTDGFADALAPVPRVITFGELPDADIRLSASSQEWRDANPVTKGTIDDKTNFTLPTPGKHNAINALCAFAIARDAGMTDTQTATALESLEPAPMRLQHTRAADISIFCDAYNANPDSMRAAIVTFTELTKDHARRIIIIGDMLELGDHAIQMHEEIGRCIAANLKPDLLVAIGQHAPHIAYPIEKAHPDITQIILSSLDESQCQRIAARIEPGDAVLIKASRSLSLERIARAIEARAAATAR